MDFDYIKYRKERYIVSVKLTNKEQYYSALTNIENGITGRIDVLFVNTFISEANKLIINSIELFEMGYFDCSFYSLRQVLELATIMMYLVDIDGKTRKEKMESWKNQECFPMYAQMHKYLEDNGDVYVEMKEKLKDYFSELEVLKNKLNKYVHKQGGHTFYTLRNRVKPSEEKLNLFADEFEQYLMKCIGAVAVFRLAIDPLPILLNDKDIYNRTPDFMTESYNDDFIKKYIGDDVLIKYKQTKIYSSAYDHIMKEEERPQCVVDIIKHQFIDKDKVNEIYDNARFLSQVELVAVTIGSFSDKVANIYCNGGLTWYHTNTKSKRQNDLFNSETFKKFDELNNKDNLEYDEVYLTYFEFKGEDFYIEHNDIFTEGEIKFLKMFHELPNKLATFEFESQEEEKDNIE